MEIRSAGGLLTSQDMIKAGEGRSINILVGNSRKLQGQVKEMLQKLCRGTTRTGERSTETMEGIIIMEGGNSETTNKEDIENREEIGEWVAVIVGGLEDTLRSKEIKIKGQGVVVNQGGAEEEVLQADLSPIHIADATRRYPVWCLLL